MSRIKQSPPYAVKREKYNLFQMFNFQTHLGLFAHFLAKTVALFGLQHI